MKLCRTYVEKPWGRTQLPPMFEVSLHKRIGEVWFANAPELPLLAKYIFTSERLSIQVHPGDEQAQARGLRQRQERMLVHPGRRTGCRSGPGAQSRAVGGRT